MRLSKYKEKPNQFLIVLYNLSKGGKDMVPLNVIAKECGFRPVDLQKIVNEYAREGLVRYEPANQADSHIQMGGIRLTEIGKSIAENT